MVDIPFSIKWFRMKQTTQKKNAGRPAQGVVREWESMEVDFLIDFWEPKESQYNTKHTDYFNKDIRWIRGF